MTAAEFAPRRDVSFLLMKVYPVLRALVRVGYFSLHVEGAENVPRQGRRFMSGTMLAGSRWTHSSVASP